MTSLITNNKVRIALYQPRIPQNTGNIARTCAAFNFKLDLISPLGFSLEDKYLKRAGLDYWQYLDIDVHQSFDTFLYTVSPSRMIAFSKKGITPLSLFEFNSSDVLLFGREDNGLPNDVINQCSNVISIPMPGGVVGSNKGGVRSLNLSVACGIIAYEASLQLGNI